MAKKLDFQLDFPENLKKDIANTTSTRKMAFDDLGDFIEERERLRRLLEQGNEAELRVDYSDFANHVFFDSAMSKFIIAKDRILNRYPYNGNAEEKDAFALTGSGYENYIFEQWPRHVGYATLNGTSQYISASDVDHKLVLGTSSFMVSAWVNPTVNHNMTVVEVVSGSTVGTNRNGFRMLISGSNDPQFRFTVLSGATAGVASGSYTAYTGSWHNIAGVYDRNANFIYAFIDGRQVGSASLTIGPIEPNDLKVLIGSASNVPAASPFDFYSGSIDEVRIYHTASILLLQKNYDNPIDSEEYLKLRYTFNEGVVGTASIDEIVVDYSKSGLHGKFLNYASTCRVSGVAMLQDPGDPILYSFHSDVQTFSGTQVLSASLYDKNNNNQIFNLIPEYILRVDDDQEGLMTAFALAMARFFDNLKLYIDQFDNLKTTNYDEVDDVPDLFLPYLTRYFGWKVTEHFGDANPLSFYFGKGVLSSGSLEVPLYEIKNQFWRRILNNLPYLLKTKGKRSNLDSFFNVLGINRENINLKEYGYLPGGSIVDTRIHKEKVASFLGIGTGSLSSSFVKVPNLISGTNNAYTVEAFVQLPFVSASYSGNLSVLTGSVWQFVDSNQVTGSFALLWNIPALGSTEGKFILTGSTATGASQRFSSSLVEVFDGDFVYIAAGLKANQIPFIEIRTLDNDEIDFTASFTGSVALSGVFTGSNYDFIMGATSGTFFQKQTQGFFGQYRYWNRPLSASEITDHAYNFESVGINDPAEIPHPLRGHWPLNEYKNTDSGGNLNGVQDLSRLGYIATGTLFLPNYNPYDKFLVEYNYLSPSVDLKWTENKIRIRNKDELKLSDIANDTNEVSLEFNLVDALNRDITKIFASFDLMNNAIGRPVNKYRDEYADLEAQRKVYFDRLGDSIHFSAFFNLFKWFDKRLSDSIKQLLPTRVKFIGGEQVVESHMLERPRYGYKYPIFRTPVDIPNAEVDAFSASFGDLLPSLQNARSAMGSAGETAFDAVRKKVPVLRLRNSAYGVDDHTVGYYSADDETGNFEADWSTFGNACDLSNVLTPVSGVVGSAFNFPILYTGGTAGPYLDARFAIQDMTISGGFAWLVSGTIEFWHRPPDNPPANYWTTGSDRWFFNITRAFTDGSGIYLKLMQQSSNTLLLQARSGSIIRNASVASYDGGFNWTHYRVTFNGDADQMKLYINGVERASGQFPILKEIDECWIGQGANNPTSAANRPRHGYFDEVRISNFVRPITGSIADGWSTYMAREKEAPELFRATNRESLVVPEGDYLALTQYSFGSGDERIDRNLNSDVRYIGSTFYDVSDATGSFSEYYHRAAVDSSGAIYVIGQEPWTIIKGHISSAYNENGWFTLDERPNDTANDIVVNGNDHIFICGVSGSGGGIFEWIIRSSSDRGLTWGEVDKRFPIDFNGVSAAHGLAVRDDINTVVYAVGTSGTFDGSSYPSTWIIRQSNGAGVSGTWSTVDTWLTSSFPSKCAWSHGKLFVVGNRTNDSIFGTQEWIVRSGTANDFGVCDSWSDTIDSGAIAYDIKKAPNNDLYVVGDVKSTAYGQSSRDHILVRRSTFRLVEVSPNSFVQRVGETGSWVNVDIYLSSGLPAANAFPLFEANVNGLSIDSNGAMYLVGRHYVSGALGDRYNYLVRTSQDGLRWETIDNFDIGAGNLNDDEGFGIIAANPNTIISFGFADDGSQNHSIMRGYTKFAHKPFFRIKVSGDTQQDINNSVNDINQRNEFARKLLTKKDRDNE